MRALSYRQRLGLLALLFGCGLLLLFARLVLLQVLSHDEWVAQAERLRSGWRVVPPVRGRIEDARGRVLAHDAAGFELSVLALAWKNERHECAHCGAEHYVAPGQESPSRCRRCRKRGSVQRADRRSLRPVARLLKMPEAELRARIRARVTAVEELVERELEGLSGRKRGMQEKELWFDHGRRPKRVQSNVSYAVAREVALHPRRNPAFRIQTNLSRLYPGGAAFAHILGRLRDAAPTEVVRDDGSSRRVVFRTGVSGLEYHFEEALRGEAGWVETERDLRRRSRRIVYEKPAVPGKRIRLTIDARDQERAAQAIGGAAAGFAVVHAETGAVVALATAPSYEPKRYAATLAEWMRARDRLAEGQVLRGSPITERSYRSFQPPGSIMKPFTAIAALEAGDGSFGEVVTCERDFRYRGRRVSGMLRCNDRHGEIDMHGALAISCNVYFQTILARMLETEHFPVFAENGRRFGFGQPTGIEVEGRASGHWDFSDVRHAGVLISSAIGQGTITLSPAQMARAYAAIATGYLPRLHLVASVGGSETRVRRVPLGVDPRHLERVRDALRAVPRPGGSAASSGLARWRIACKTGTAQLASTGYERYNAWMAGFAPGQHGRPPIAFAMVVLRSPVGGAHACGPRLQEFFRYFYGGSE